ncbi:hypothetical protein [Wenjunlia tyrosinilytica]|uniref:Uncharacterized protein n=1 Tax=Wenjunlia tyrosinilytica TaxID=1544741 RepID=A0A917ZQ98_9ACTN|nr:hypothetical protein [Wenjunlia tyrosinilytica]GGO88811.1 hypothetical protein GCM10012280_30480 [Wenjunlia tyrosinilytica]
MDGEFEAAFEPVLRDLRASCAVLPDVRVEDHWVMLFAPDGSGQGVAVWPCQEFPDQVANLADQVQEWAVEALWSQGLPAVWPQCPDHPDAHPLTAVVSACEAVWTCPKTARQVAAVGQLPGLS